MPLGNYGVVERYYIDITNNTDAEKEVTYNLKGNSHVFVTYKAGDAGWETKLKVAVEPFGGDPDRIDSKYKNETWEAYYARTGADMFSINLAPGETKQLIMEVILPNADNGGIESKLTAN